jgi:hypothetical protein
MHSSRPLARACAVPGAGCRRREPCSRASLDLLLLDGSANILPAINIFNILKLLAGAYWRGRKT